jgi:hypothetical protein
MSTILTARILLTAATILALGAPANAEMSKAGVPAGMWCSIANPSGDPDNGWMFFKRGKCTSDENDNGAVTLILKANGDYAFTGVGDDMDCKVNAKSYFKGWADYNCITHGAREMKQKRNQKFLIDTGNGQLALSPLD